MDYCIGYPQTVMVACIPLFSLGREKNGQTGNRTRDNPKLYYPAGNVEESSTPTLSTVGHYISKAQILCVYEVMIFYLLNVALEGL
jgi:hypothetical protein